VWNRDPQKCAPLREAGATGARTAAEAARAARRVHLALSADAAVDAVLDAMLSAIGEDAVLVDHSTTQPEATAARAARCAAAGVAFLHAPVFMSPTACLQGQGSMLVAGDAAVFARCQADLEAMTGAVHFVGAEPDAAATLKLVGNCYIVAAIGALADGFAIGRARGLSPERCHAVFRALDPRVAVMGRGGRMAKGDLDETFWSLVMARKDVRLMQETAGPAAAAVVPALAARLDALIAAGLGDRDLGVLGLPAKALPDQRGESTVKV
ncbi:MAG: NAD(P)-dependent oxidoreductase, partial [Myxococcales bacterium]|nr:NAD(P)-dependent oxidoreductase [Myxococcales bacterium]